MSTTVSTLPRASIGAAIPVYGAAVLQGLAVVSFPASSAELQHHYGLSDGAYGSLFLPQMIFTIAGSLAGGALAHRIGLRALLALATVAALGSQICLRSVAWVPEDARLYLLWLGTALMGTGFGLAAAPLNAFPALLFPKRAATALVAVHTMVGAGFAIGPLCVSALTARGWWTAFPAALATAAFISIAFTLRTPLPSTAERSGTRASIAWGPLALFFAIAIVYAFAEGTFANWAIAFLTEHRNVAPELAAIALSSFWAALAGGRLLVSALLAFVPAPRFWLALPIAMSAVLLALPLVSGAASGIALFALAGLACSAFFPLTVEMAVRSAGGAAAAPAISSMLIAALMIGVGGGSFVLGALTERVGLESLYRIAAAGPALAFVLAAVVLLRMRKEV